MKHPPIYRETFPKAGCTCAYIDKVWDDVKQQYVDRPENQVPEHLQEGVRILLLLEMRPASERIQ